MGTNLAWAASNEVRWFTTQCCGQIHRFFLHPSTGFWFDDHMAGPEALAMESVFFKTEDLSTCHILSLWWVRRRFVEKVIAVHNKEAHSVRFAIRLMVTPTEFQRVEFETSPLGGSLFARVVHAVEPGVIFEWHKDHRRDPVHLSVGPRR